MRFDDRLKTVLAADSASAFGAQASWRQLVDLAGWGRVAVDATLLARLSALREAVPVAVRSASARAVALSRPDAALVGFLAEDEITVAAPVLRMATLPAGDWLALLPRLTPAGRAVLRGRRDLPDEVVRGLESLGPVDFTLAYAVPDAALEEEVAVTAERMPAAPSFPPANVPRSPSPFVPLGEVAQRLPLVAEAQRRIEEEAGRFEIADIVARIDAFKRDREPPVVPAAPEPVDRFRFETDPEGVIRWIEGPGRAGVVGVTLARAGAQGVVRIDAAVAGAVAGRSRIDAGRLDIAGAGELAGTWRLIASPNFDPASGRFTGYAGTATRAARHQRAERGAAADALRELVHELRTPANAVAGFAEFIEVELFGPVPSVYRDRATDIRRRAGALLGAIDDLDVAARIEAAALDLRTGRVDLAALLADVAASLRPLAELRGARLVVEGTATAALDPEAAERLVARLAATLLALAEPGEAVAVRMRADGSIAMLTFDRPLALSGLDEAALLALGADENEDAPLLGTGFTLRLIRNLAREAGGAFAIEPGCLTLRLPTVLSTTMEQVAIH